MKRIRLVMEVRDTENGHSLQQIPGSWEDMPHSDPKKSSIMTSLDTILDQLKQKAETKKEP